MFFKESSKKFKDILPKGLYSRSLLIIIVPVVVLQGILTFVFLDRHWQLVTRKLSSAVASEIATFVDVAPSLGLNKVVELSKKFYDAEVNYIPNQKLINNIPKPINLVENTLSKELSKIMTDNFWVDAHTYEKRVIVQIEKEGGIYEFTIPRRNVSCMDGNFLTFISFCCSHIYATTNQTHREIIKSCTTIWFRKKDGKF